MIIEKLKQVRNNSGDMPLKMHIFKLSIAKQRFTGIEVSRLVISSITFTITSTAHRTWSFRR